MRKLYFLLPGTYGKFACGGLWAELKTMNLAAHICSAEVITYRQREKNHLFLEDVIQQDNLRDVIFVISWGFDIAQLVRKLQKYHVVYHAHSSGYKFYLPPSIPIITVSRNTMGYWGQKSPGSLVYYLPNQISDEFQNLNLHRHIDVLVQARKSSEYLIKSLIHALENRCQVTLINSYVEDLPGLFNRAKIYLYDSAEYWAQQQVSEGFGLQPMEALACGCHVFSSVNGGLSDYLDPGFNCHKIAGYSREYDVKRIINILQSSANQSLSTSFLSEYRTGNIIARLQVILTEINDFFDERINLKSNIEELSPTRLTKLRLCSLYRKLRQQVLRARHENP